MKLCLSHFISATKILPALVPLLKEGASVVVLVKPQFEVGRGEVGKGGVVRDPAQHARVVAEVNACALALGLAVGGVTESPVTGADGNREFLALYEKSMVQARAVLALDGKSPQARYDVALGHMRLGQALGADPEMERRGTRDG